MSILRAFERKLFVIEDSNGFPVRAKNTDVLSAATELGERKAVYVPDEKWILVSERKPSHDETVLAWKPGWCRPGAASMYEDGLTWLDVEACRDMLGITHWQPMPLTPSALASSPSDE